MGKSPKVGSILVRGVTLICTDSPRLFILWMPPPQPRALEYWGTQIHNVLRASPTVLSMWHQRVKFIAKESKRPGLAQEIGFSAPNLCSLQWLVKGATQLCTSKKECNELVVTAAQYFWLVDHNDGSRLFAISTPHIQEFQLEFYWWGCQKNI